MKKPKSGMGIYQIRNLINGKIYIGSTNDFKRRHNEHQVELRGNRHHCKHLQNSWNKYGEDVFVFEILEKLDNVEKLIGVEQKYLDRFHPEYNITYDARSPARGMVVSDKTRKLLSKLQSGKNNSFYGGKHSKETLKKISASGKGHKMSEHQKRILMENHYSKLTWEQVREIRQLYTSGRYTQKEIAKIFNVCRPNITYIVNNKTWKEENSNL